MDEIKRIVRSYSPWITDEMATEWERMKSALPSFRRPIFDELQADALGGDQIVSVAGPRRVGKTTLLRQLVQTLLDSGVTPERIIYYSMDDPVLYRPGMSGELVIEQLMEYLAHPDIEKPAYLLLDEIQSLNRWEQYLKKYYDLKYPIKIVISGSASSPIFKGSRESLLGRVKDHHILPFSFREFLLYTLAHDAQTDIIGEVDNYRNAGASLMGMFAKDPAHVDTTSVDIPYVSDELWLRMESALNEYLVDGGFPEVWKFNTQEEKIEYLFNNQVNKVIMEDLVLAVEFRKPEQLKTFYISLLERPGREVNMTTLSGEIGVSPQQIDKYLPLLEMTDLIRSAAKFRKSAVRVRKGAQKFYPVDLALRNAVLRVGSEILDEPDTLGLYAETLVFNALKKWRGILQVDYYRDGQQEVDFIVHTRPQYYLPVEVKYAANTGAGQLKGLSKFQSKYQCHIPVVVTRERADFGAEKTGSEQQIFRVPLPLFLLMFD